MATPLRQNDPILNSLNLITGLWLMVSPVFLPYPPGASGAATSIVVGSLIAIFSAIKAFGLSKEAWLSWLCALLGLWIIISSWLLNVHTLWRDVIAGIIVVMLSIASAIASQRTYGRSGWVNF